MHQQDALTTEYVRTAVAATGVDPTGLAAQMAIVPTGADPESADWNASSWETDTSTDPPTYYARLLVGPDGGDVELTAGVLYDVYVRVADPPETVIRNSGALAAL